MAHSSNEYMRDYMLTYRKQQLKEALWKQHWTQFSAKMEEQKTHFLVQVHAEIKIAALNFLLDRLEVTEVQRSEIKDARLQMDHALDKMMVEAAKNFDEHIEMKKPECYATFERIFETVTKQAEITKPKTVILEKLEEQLKNLEVPIEVPKLGDADLKKVFSDRTNGIV